MLFNGDTTVPSSVPIAPKENPAKIAVMSSRWRMVKTQDGGSQLLKTYTFRTLKQRSSFVSGLMSYETAVKHMGRISMNGTDVTVQLWTDGIDSVSELDREYAAFADTAYKDVTYCTHSEDKI